MNHPPLKKPNHKSLILILITLSIFSLIALFFIKIKSTTSDNEFNNGIEQLQKDHTVNSNYFPDASQLPIPTHAIIEDNDTENTTLNILDQIPKTLLETKYGVLFIKCGPDWNLITYELNPGNTFIASLTKYNQIQIRFVSSYFPEDLRTFYDELPEGGIHEPGMADSILPPPDRNYVEDIYTEDLIEISTSSYKLYRPKVGTFGYYRSYTMPHNKQMAFYMPINGKYTDELPIWGHEDKWDYLKVKYELINSPEIQEESNKDYSEYIENLFKEADEIVSTLTYVPNE